MACRCDLTIGPRLEPEWSVPLFHLSISSCMRRCFARFEALRESFGIDSLVLTSTLLNMRRGAANAAAHLV